MNAPRLRSYPRVPGDAVRFSPSALFFTVQSARGTKLAERGSKANGLGRHPRLDEQGIRTQSPLELGDFRTVQDTIFIRVPAINRLSACEQDRELRMKNGAVA